MDRIEALKIYCQIVDCGGLNKAAKILGVSPALVSQCLARLETLYGVRLIERSTRRIAVTEAGQKFYGQALRLIDDYHAMEKSIRGAKGQAQGLLRLTLPLGLAMTFIYPHLHEFTDAYPGIALDIQVSDYFADLVEHNFDLGLRAGTLPDSDLVAILLGRYRRLTCASPDYLSRSGTPTHPDQLFDHECLIYRHDRLPVQWRYWVDGQMRPVQVRGRHSANETHALLTMARNGMGLTGQPEWLVAPDLAQGRLVSVLDDFVIPPSHHAPGIFAILPSGRYRTAKVDHFIEFAKTCIVRGLGSR